MSKKAEISRSNGAKSRGPVTPEGKAISSQNSRTHGLTSARVVLPHESREDYVALEASLYGAFSPVGAFECDLVQEMAACRWRLRRVQEMESALLDRAIRNAAENLQPGTDAVEAQALAYAEFPESKAFRQLSRYQGQIRRAYEKAWKELEALQQKRQAEEAEHHEAEHHEAEHHEAEHHETEHAKRSPLQIEPGVYPSYEPRMAITATATELSALALTL